MKTITASIFLKPLRFAFICLFLISTNHRICAQEDLKRTYLKLSYTKNSDGSKILTAKISYKENRKFVAINNATISFFTGIELDELIKKVNTNSKGIASIQLPEDLQADTSGFASFEAKFKSTDKYKRSSKDISVKDARLELSFNQESEGRSITIKGFEIKNEDEELPLNEEEVLIFVPTLFGDMQIGKSVLEDGTCLIDFPSDLPGDSVGNIVIIAKIDDSEIYGNVVCTDNIPWGMPKPISQIKESDTKGKLWTYNAPIWMVITLSILVLGVWSHFGYVIYKMYKINKEGIEKAN